MTAKRQSEERPKVDPALTAIAIEWESVERTSNGLDGPSMSTVISRPYTRKDGRGSGETTTAEIR